MTYTLKLTEDELQALAGLLDAGVRAQGMRAVLGAAPLVQKLESLKPDPETAST